MSRAEPKPVILNLATAGLLVVGLLIAALLAAATPAARANPGTLFASTTGSGATCSQAAPCPLATALLQAAGGDTLYVATGTYTSTGPNVITITASIALYGGWDGSPTVPVVRDPRAYPTTLDGENARRVVSINGSVTPTLDGFIITRGNASNAAVGVGQGAGIRSVTAAPIIQNNILTNNVAYAGTAWVWGEGGGIYLASASASALISGNHILSNTASLTVTGRGGGIYLIYSDATVRNNRIQGNEGSFEGGGVYIWQGSPQVLDNEIQANRAGRNGGGLSYNSWLPAWPVIHGNLILGNSTGPGWHGGGIMIGGYVSPTLTANRILSNTANDSGGIGLEISGYFTVANNIVGHNTGGGIRLWDLTRYGLIAHNTIAFNGGEGGIRLAYGYITPTIVNNIIVSNTYGLSADSAASGTLNYNEVWGNTVQDYNLPGALEPGANDLQADPLFVDAAADDYHLRLDSPGIDAGTGAGITSDIDGDLRPLGPGYDLGADEARRRYLYLPVILKSSPWSTATHSAGASGATYYVRTDGGSPAQCTGLADAAYPGSGTGQPCAWDHPFRALPPGGAPRISGGDTLIVGAGSYMMGYGAPGADTCDAGGAYGCHMLPIPSGPSPANPTRILGAGWNSGCAGPPELWGAERPWFIVNMTDSSNVELACLEITDHSGCVEFHSGGLACERDTPPYGTWASYGLYAEDSANVYLHDLNIHGLAAGGVHAGRLTDWTVEDVRIAGNGSVGWDGDLWDALGDSNSGTLTFRRWTVEWNGCGETYPGEQPTGCWAQSAGGYGDGFATGLSGGHWIVEDSVVRYNTSDGLDFLYIREPGSSITIRRTLAKGNAGNQIKNFRGPFLIENSIIVGNCGFFDGQPFTYNVDNCRAMGDALDLGLMAGDHITVTNNTISGEGDCLVGAEAYGTPNGTERVRLRNNIFIGQTDFIQPFENTCLAYQETFPANPFDIDYSVITNTKDTPPCPGAHDQCGVAPGLVSTAIDSFNAHLVTGSPAINAGTSSGAPLNDFDGRLRDALPDIGAYEWRPPAAAWVYLPVIRR